MSGNEAMGSGAGLSKVGRSGSSTHLLAKEVLEARCDEPLPLQPRRLAVVLDVLLDRSDATQADRVHEDLGAHRLRAKRCRVLLEVVIELAIVQHRVALPHLDEMLQGKALPARENA